MIIKRSIEEKSGSNIEIKELNLKNLKIIAKKFEININDFLKNQDIRKIIIESLGFNQDDQFLVKNERIFIIHSNKEEKRFKGYNKNELNFIVLNSGFFDEKGNFLLDKNFFKDFDFNNLHKDEIKNFLTTDFKKYINKYITTHIKNELSDNSTEEGLSQFLYREGYEEINSIILNKLIKSLESRDYNLIGFLLKDSLLKYLNIDDKTLINIFDNTLSELDIEIINNNIIDTRGEIEKKEIEKKGVEKRIQEYENKIKLLKGKRFKKAEIKEIRDTINNKRLNQIKTELKMEIDRLKESFFKKKNIINEIEMYREQYENAKRVYDQDLVIFEKIVMDLAKVLF